MKLLLEAKTSNQEQLSWKYFDLTKQEKLIDQFPLGVLHVYFRTWKLKPASLLFSRMGKFFGPFYSRRVFIKKAWIHFYNNNGIWRTVIIYISKVGDCSWGRPEGSLFNSYYTEVYGRALLLSLNCSTLLLISTLYCWVLSKEVSSTIFKVFGMMRPGIEPRSPRPLANSLPTRLMSQYIMYILVS